MTAVTLPVSLAAAAVTLRDFGQAYDIQTYRAVADLIDGTLRLHLPNPRLGQAMAFCSACTRQDLGSYPCLTLRLLVPVVRAFLPDWNPDTEETP